MGNRFRGDNGLSQFVTITPRAEQNQVDDDLIIANNLIANATRAGVHFRTEEIISGRSPSTPANPPSTSKKSITKPTEIFTQGCPADF